MLQQQKLETEKYVQQELEKWAEDVRVSRNRKAIRDFSTFLVGLAMMALGVFLAGTMHEWPYWIDNATQWFRS